MSEQSHSSKSNEQEEKNSEIFEEMQRIKQRESEKNDLILDLSKKNEELMEENHILEDHIEKKKKKIQDLKCSNQQNYENKELAISSLRTEIEVKNSQIQKLLEASTNDKFKENQEKFKPPSTPRFNKWSEKLLLASKIQNMKAEGNQVQSEKEKQFKTSDAKYQNHEETIQNLEVDLSIMSLNLKTSQNKAKDLKKENDDLIEEVEGLKAKIKEYKKTIKQQQSEIENFEKQAKDLKKINKDLGKQIEELNQNLDVQLKKSLKFKEKWKESKNELLGFKSHYNLNQKTKKELKSDKKLPTLTYDIVINIDSLKSQTIGWDIWINERNLEMINACSNNTIIGLVGRENIGKTFILNKLCGFELPSGSNVHTKGLSMKYSNAKNNDLICLDSAGIQTPVYYFDEKLMDRFSVNKEDLNRKEYIKRQMINDRTITDTFIQDFILDVCEVILIVVGQLTQNDQKFIERIAWKYQAKKRIIVVHNFSNLYSVEDVNNRIDMDIIKAFDTKPRIIPNRDIYEYIEKKENKSKDSISHLVLGVDWSNSGKKFNDPTFEHIMKIIDTRLEKRTLNLIEKLKNFFQKNFNKYLRFKQRPKKTPYLEEVKKSLMIRTNEEFEIPNPIFDAFGDLITSPPYEVFERKNQFVCLIEIPDLNQENLKLEFERKETEFCCLIVEGLKNWSELADKDNIVNITGNRSCGDFRCRIPLGPAYYRYKMNIDQNDRKYKYEDGILKIEINCITEEVEEL